MPLNLEASYTCVCYPLPLEGGVFFHAVLWFNFSVPGTFILGSKQLDEGSPWKEQT